MAFGAYPQKHERMSVALKRPLLDEGGPASDASEDLEYEPELPFLSRYLHRRGRLSRYLLHIVSLAAGIVIFILGFQSVLIWKIWRQPGHPEALGEFNGLVPSVETQLRLFAPDPAFDPLNISDQGWMSVMPTGGGFVTVQDWRGKALPAPIQAHGKDMYNIAVFHQLHCLHTLAEEFGNLLAGRHGGHGHDQAAGGGSSSSMGEDGETGADAMMVHVQHCFEYIKASLTCCADTALEGQKADIDRPAADGFGSHHVCRNFDAVFDWAETHRASGQTGYPHPQ